ncbi:MAG: glycosyltransferase family 1 protein [Bryobacteraceae bacterium]|jgi:glycosyltransferase involved in cell wall biosynthesis
MPRIRRYRAITFLLRSLRWSARHIEAHIGRHGPVVIVHPRGRPRGSVVLAYHTDPWVYPATREHHYHTNRWECGLLGDTFVEAGYRLEVVEFDNPHYRPPADCAYIIDLERNLERFAKIVPASCVKIQHASTTHWLHWNQAELRRLDGIRQRRGAVLVPRRQIPFNLTTETADRIIYVGNAYTAETLAFAGKPMQRIPISTVVQADWPEQKNFDQVRRNFTWFGSVGLAHKGLDLALEAFARMPGFNLTVVGAINLDADFKQLYHRELNELPNIRTPGWVSATSSEFLTLLRDQVGVVYPSCSEGGAGSVICCLHGGLIPIVTREASVDVQDFGFETRSDAVEDIMTEVHRVAELPVAELAARARAAWEHVRAVHTREHFRHVWRDYARASLGLPLSGE